jgi:DeoR/GlpR family transcriptional regulator of sugar metabolism
MHMAYEGTDQGDHEPHREDFALSGRKYTLTRLNRAHHSRLARNYRSERKMAPKKGTGNKLRGRPGAQRDEVDARRYRLIATAAKRGGISIAEHAGKRDLSLRVARGDAEVLRELGLVVIDDNDTIRPAFHPGTHASLGGRLVQRQAVKRKIAKAIVDDLQVLCEHNAVRTVLITHGTTVHYVADEISRRRLSRITVLTTSLLVADLFHRSQMPLFLAGGWLSHQQAAFQGDHCARALEEHHAADVSVLGFSGLSDESPDEDGRGPLQGVIRTTDEYEVSTLRTSLRTARLRVYLACDSLDKILRTDRNVIGSVKDACEQGKRREVHLFYPGDPARTDAMGYLERLADETGLLLCDVNDFDD